MSSQLFRSKISSLNFLALRLLFLGAPLAVTTGFRRIFPLLGTSRFLLLFAAVAACLWWWQSEARLFTDRTGRILTGLIFAPFAWSIVMVGINLLWTEKVDYVAFFYGNFVGRLSNLIPCFILVSVGWCSMRCLPPRRSEALFMTYFFSAFIFAMLGLWQGLSAYFPQIPVFPWITRSDLPPIGHGMQAFFRLRLTSIASEPSFLAPLLTDALLFGLALKGFRHRWVNLAYLPMAIVLLLSFSLGGYGVLMVLGGCGSVLALSRFRLASRSGFKNVSRISACLLLVGAAGVFFLTKVEAVHQMMAPVIGRLNGAELAAMSRVQMMLSVPQWAGDLNPLAWVFGNGPASFKLIHTYRLLPSGVTVDSTSNNLFIDFIYECGFLGLLFALAFFAYAISIGVKNRHKDSRYIWGALLSLSLMGSSMYRGDYASPRFWIVVLGIFYLYETARQGQGLAEKQAPTSS